MLVDCTVITDRETKASKGYAFVKYRTAEEALKALNADISINNTKLIVSFACQNAKHRTAPDGPSIQERKLVDRKLFIRNVPFEANEDDLRIVFDSYGPIQELVVCRDRNTGKSKGFGFITYETDKATYACLEEPIKRDRSIVVSLAKEGKEQIKSKQEFSGNLIQGRTPTVENTLTQPVVPELFQQYYSMPFWGMNPTLMPYTGIMTQQMTQGTNSNPNQNI
ncbi:hypothetical protein JH06_3544 [Blastocystis sp. subtype 4]|uniref:hypothetical protein n=1 Tax=Blastocystis sp. subtype 4 TaxID=944170 RepID=UPI000711581B|nr:hypothetical protein JH06_3544 [Blastocystis sp. subtype 4]KNB44945.1 hypothetical protein JH06_3544 [Blastocystis sp. subtype 4]|eukprot:XP_014528408.1 hypothetical protein JH06_3544 [Blastocystis sp. subtype 4]